MLKVALTYTRQRFHPETWLALAAFLILTVKSSLWVTGRDLITFFLSLLSLFTFRLFDDLQNREFDKGKAGRAYTSNDHFLLLRKLWLLFALATTLFHFILSWQAGLLFTGFLVLNLPLYKYLLPKGKSRWILPLLKYPVLAIIALILLNEPTADVPFSMLVAASLLPLFILFESLTDEAFHIGRPWQFILFLLAFAVFILPVNSLSFMAIAIKISVAITAFAAALLTGSKASAYFLPLAFLINSILNHYEF